MTTDARTSHHHSRRMRADSGQSLLEFVLLVPVLILFPVILIKVNSAIQSSIVHQRFVGTQPLFLARNSAYYPNVNQQPNLIANRVNQVFIGMSSNMALSQGYNPIAPEFTIAKKKGLGSREPKREPATRGDVRIRNTATLCSAPFVAQDGSPLRAPQGARFIYRITENTQIDPCKGDFNL